MGAGVVGGAGMGAGEVGVFDPDVTVPGVTGIEVAGKVVATT